MLKIFVKYFQKIKWGILARINPKYFIWSSIKNNDKDNYSKSGRASVEELVINDDFLKSNIDFKNTSVLEIGCGNGRMTEFIAQNFKRVYAIDISKKMIDLAHDRLKDYNNINFFVTSGSHFPIGDATIDLAFSYIVFQHFPNKKIIIENLKEIKRILKNTGLAKIQFRGKISSGGLLRIFKWYYGVYFSEKEIGAILFNLGLKPLKIYKTNEKEVWAIFKKQEQFI